MTDIRNYAPAVREAIKTATANDESYTWKVQAINKSEARFSWSYIGENKNELFVLTVEEEFDEPCIIVDIPCTDHKSAVLVGDKFWRDAKTMEEGIKEVIRIATNFAKRNF